MPNARTQLKNLVFSVANVLAYSRYSGKIRAEAEIVGVRVDICKKCRHLDDTRCTVCGCYVTLKAGLIAETCPLKKW